MDDVSYIPNDHNDHVPEDVLPMTLTSAELDEISDVAWEHWPSTSALSAAIEKVEEIYLRRQPDVSDELTLIPSDQVAEFRKLMSAVRELLSKPAEGLSTSDLAQMRAALNAVEEMDSRFPTTL